LSIIPKNHIIIQPDRFIRCARYSYSAIFPASTATKKFECGPLWERKSGFSGQVALVPFNGKFCKIRVLCGYGKSPTTCRFFKQIRPIVLKNPIEQNQCRAGQFRKKAGSLLFFQE